jgi:hypothetical protein
LTRIELIEQLVGVLFIHRLPCHFSRFQVHYN